MLNESCMSLPPDTRTDINCMKGHNHKHLYATTQKNTSYYNTYKIDTKQYNIRSEAKNVRGKHPNYSDRDSIKGSSWPYFHNGPLRGAGTTTEK